MTNLRVMLSYVLVAIRKLKHVSSTMVRRLLSPLVIRILVVCTVCWVVVLLITCVSSIKRRCRWIRRRWARKKCLGKLYKRCIIVGRLVLSLTRNWSLRRIGSLRKFRMLCRFMAGRLLSMKLVLLCCMCRVILNRRLFICVRMVLLDLNRPLVAIESLIEY